MAQGLGKKLGGGEILFERLPKERQMKNHSATDSPTFLIPVLGDQLTLENPALRGVSQQNAVLCLAEVIEESTHVWSSRMRSAVFLTAMRHFALLLQSQGWQVRYFKLGEHASLPEAWRHVLKQNFSEQSKVTLRVCESGDLRVEGLLKKFAQSHSLAFELLDDDHFLISRADFARWAGKSKFLRMEMFYRMMRKRESVLMQGDEPVGGQWNFDADNRESFGKGGPKGVPQAPQGEISQITEDVFADLAQHLPTQPGAQTQPSRMVWPVTREQGLKALDAFIEQRLARFGPTQDAMWTGEPFLFHSLLSVALNLKLLSPREVIVAVCKAYEQGRAPIASVEGFVRQILGWREFIRGVYWLDSATLPTANHLDHHAPLPKWYWTGQTQMNCMAQAIGQTLEWGYAHHIQRLMITGNFALIAGLLPQAVCDWYLAVYVDAVEWVELPNTAGMALFANGGRFTTKPYAASGAYVKRMSNYCSGCRYDPGVKVGPKACPMTTFYWNFLDRHRQELESNPRAALMMKNFARLSEADVTAIRKQAQHYLSQLDEL